KLIEELPLSTDIVREVVQILEEKQIYYELFSEDGLLIGRNKTEFLYEEIGQYYGEEEKSAAWTTNIIETQMQQYGIIPISDFSSIDLSHQSVYKIMVLCFDLEKLAHLRKELSKKVVISLTTSGQEKLKISQEDTSKRNSLKMIADYFNVPLENTVAIGDSMNDTRCFKKPQ